jgi:hypothetical protein
MNSLAPSTFQNGIVEKFSNYGVCGLKFTVNKKGLCHKPIEFGRIAQQNPEVFHIHSKLH